MKLPTLFITLALGAAASLSTAPVHAQDACPSYLCMAGMAGSGTTGGPGCAAPTQAFFSIIVVDEEGIDFPATSAARRIYLMTCPGATTATNATILNTIITKYGETIM